jgi:hypothetical protein
VSLTTDPRSRPCHSVKSKPDPGGRGMTPNATTGVAHTLMGTEQPLQSHSPTSRR